MLLHAVQAIKKYLLSAYKTLPGAGETAAEKTEEILLSWKFYRSRPQAINKMS